MDDAGAPSPTGRMLSLHATRALLDSRASRAAVGLVALLYALIAMIVGGMLQITFPPSRAPAFLWLIPVRDGNWWSYPAFIAGGPYFLLAVPLLSSILMVLVATGIGLGMTAAVVVSVRSIRARRAAGTVPSMAGPLAGLTPALVALLTLGACCSTTAAATAGIELTAQASGTSSTTLLLNSWYLGLFQAVVVYAALIAQERLLVLFAPPTRAPTDPGSVPGRVASPSGGVGRTSPPGRTVLTRALLLGAGLAWSLSAFTVFFSPVPTGHLAVAAFIFLVQHQLPAGAAVLCALFPSEILAWFQRRASPGPKYIARIALLVSGGALLTWMPLPWSAEGAGGLVNKLLSLAAPGALGAATSTGADLLGLILRWGFEAGFLGAFGLAAALLPSRTFRRLRGLPDDAVASPLPSLGTALDASREPTSPTP